MANVVDWLLDLFYLGASQKKKKKKKKKKKTKKNKTYNIKKIPGPKEGS